MPKVKKTNSIPRVITEKDFKAVGVKDQDEVQFTQENGFTADVSEAAAKYLTERDAFETVSKPKSGSGSSSSDSSSSSSDKK